MPGCDCGACCDQCGHYPGCISQQGAEDDDGYDDYRLARAS